MKNSADDHNDHNDEKDGIPDSRIIGSWSMGDQVESNAQETAGLMAEMIRMRAEFETLTRENETMKRGHDTLHRMLSENAQAKSVPDLKATVRTILSEMKDENGLPLATFVGTLPAMEDLRALSEGFAQAKESEAKLEARLGEMSVLAHSLGKQMESMTERQHEVLELKGKMELVSSQKSWIESKLQSLGKQRMVVERVNVENGRLTTLFWEMEEKIREITQQNKIIGKTQVNIEALESRLLESKQSLQQVERFEIVMKESRQSVEEMAKLGEEFQLRLSEFHKSQKNIDEASNRAKEAGLIVKSMDATMNTILKNNFQLETTKKLIDGFQDTLVGVDKKVEKIHKQWNSVEKLESKIAKVEEWVKSFHQELAVASHLGDELKKVEGRVEEIRKGENDVLRVMETLEARREEMSSLRNLADEARKQSESVMQNLEFLKHREEDIAEVDGKVNGLNKLLGQTENRIQDVKTKLDGFVTLEGKMSKVEALIVESDDKIMAQLSRQASLTALGVKIDETENHACVLELKTHELLQYGDKLRTLEGRLSELDRIGKEVDGGFVRIAEQKAEVAKQEAQFRESLESHRQLAYAFEEEQKKIGFQSGELLAQFDSDRVKLKRLQEEIGYGLESVNAHKMTIKQAEERLKKVDGFLMAMEENMGTLEKRQFAMSALDVKIQEVLEVVADMENRMTLLRNEKSVIHDARKSVESLHVMMKSVHEKVEGLRAEETLVIKTQDAVKGIVSSMSEVEEKFKLLAKERTLIEEAQSQIQNLRLMMEDLKTEIKNATEEETKISEAVSKASELQFLIGEADAVISNFRRLKQKE